MLAVIIILLLPLPLVAGFFFLLAETYGLRKAHLIFTPTVVVLATAALLSNGNGFSRFVMMEIALISLILGPGGIALTIRSLKRHENWSRPLLATCAVGASLAFISVEMYRIVLDVSAP